MATAPQTIVDAIDAAILAMIAGGGAQSISVAGRSITYTDLEALRKARSHYAALADTNNPRSVRISSLKYGGTT